MEFVILLILSETKSYGDASPSPTEPINLSPVFRICNFFYLLFTIYVWQYANSSFIRDI